MEWRKDRPIGRTTMYLCCVRRLLACCLVLGLRNEDIFCPNNIPDTLHYDQACIIFENTLSETVSLFKKLDICYKCSDEFWMDVPSNKSVSLLVPIYTKVSFQYYQVEYGISSCVVHYQFEQHGVYKYFLDFSCDSVQTIIPPDCSYTSVFICIVIVLILWVLDMFRHNKLVRKGWTNAVERIRNFLKKLRSSQKEVQSSVEVGDLMTVKTAIEPLDQGEKVSYVDKVASNEQAVELISRGVNTSNSLEGIQSPSQAESKQLEFVEFEALLAFQGLFAVLWAYFSVARGSYVVMRSSPWNGLKLRDVPAGWLYWALAASFYLHLDYGLFRGKTRWRLFLRGVLLRSVLYVAGGFFYNNINNTSPLKEIPVPLNKVRVFGIFQRVGLANFITSSVEIIFIKNHIKRGPYFQDLKDTWPQWMVAVALAVTHTGITLWLPMPGCPTGYTGPGGLSNNSAQDHCTGGVAGYIDRLIFRPTHLLPPFELEGSKPSVYNIQTHFDPQGLLGTLTTCFLMSLAMQASRIFIYFHQPYGRIIRLFLWAILQLLLGGLLCGFRAEEGLIPPNRLLMSLSYVLLVSGMAYLILLMFYLFINVWKLWSANSFIYFGINLLVPLVGCQLLHNMFPFQWTYLENHRHLNISYLLIALWNVALWNIICYCLLKLKIVFPV